MPAFATPGMPGDRSTFARRALWTLVMAVVVTVILVVVVRSIPDDTTTVRIHTDDVAGGIATGTAVLLNGAHVGSVTDVDAQDSGGGNVVTVEFDSSSADPRLLTTAMKVRFAPRNLFGISAVDLQAAEGGRTLSNDSDFFPDNVDDVTLSTLLRTLSDVNDQAFRPHVSAILDQAAQATMGIAPILGVLGRLGTSLSNTQKFPPAQTFPRFATLVSEFGDAIAQVLPALSYLVAWPAPQETGYISRQRRALGFAGDTVVGGSLTDLLGPDELGRLSPVAPTLVEIFDRVQATFPDARSNGVQLESLIDRIRAAMPDGPNGPVLNVDVVLRGMPAVAEALRGGR
ncbi:MlaD family protein [Williamsia sp.]|uniref:MlaD family protein n=1 Tax=Williamsia sp. TaxID=1872085 RepID=UPI001A27979D|nr:MlaD family protein [Williamsia sp.]MBJ7291069.1 MCE family protein [Williamsia sp.]